MSAKVARLPLPARPVPETPRAAVSDTKLTQWAYEKILNAIVYGKLDLREPLSENDLAKALDVSKAPICQSLNELRLKGLVVVIPQSGSYVFSPSAKRLQSYAISVCCWNSVLSAYPWRTPSPPCYGLSRKSLKK